METTTEVQNCRTVLTIMRAPPQKMNESTDYLNQSLRQSLCFPLSSKSENLSPTSFDQPPLHRPRLITELKSGHQIEQDLLSSSDSYSPPTEMLQKPTTTYHSKTVQPTTNRLDPIGLEAIEDQNILLPFHNRPSDLMELINQPLNAPLRKKLQTVLGDQEWSQLEGQLTSLSREELCDRGYIRLIRDLVKPLDESVWVELLGLLGVDDLDEEKMKSNSDRSSWSIEPIRVGCGRALRRASMVSSSSSTSSTPSSPCTPHSARFSLSPFNSTTHHQFRRSSQSEPWDSEPSPLTGSFPSPKRPLMACIREDEQLSTADLECPIEPDEEADEEDSEGFQGCGTHGHLGFRIVEHPPCRSIPQSPSKNHYHGLKYSFGEVSGNGLGLQSI